MAKKLIKKKAKKAVKKAPAKKSAAKRTKATNKRKAPVEKAAPGMTVEKLVPGATLVGMVDDFFSHVGVIALKLQKPLAVSDSIRIKGHTTDIIQKVESIEMDHKPVQMAAKGDSVGIKIVEKARKGDAVYKI